jgi:hypothetical protein
MCQRIASSGIPWFRVASASSALLIDSSVVGASGGAGIGMGAPVSSGRAGVEVIGRLPSPLDQNRVNDERSPPMELPDVINQARDAMTVKRVFGDPYEKDGVTMIPAAKVQGAVGGGAGQGPEEQGSGSGGGYAVNARPVGAYVVRDGELSWQPALDLNRVILGGQVVAIFALVVIGAVLRARRRA